jgi:hypothetical protein
MHCELEADSIAIDLSHFDPGTYVLAFRLASGNWMFSRVEISLGKAVSLRLNFIS